MGGAEPAWNVEVLGALVAFPVGFAAEGLGTVGECAAVWSLMTFLVLPIGLMLDTVGTVVVNLATYFISQRSRVRLEQMSHWNQSCLSSLVSGAGEAASSESRSSAAERTFCSIWR